MLLCIGDFIRIVYFQDAVGRSTLPGIGEASGIDKDYSVYFRIFLTMGMTEKT